MHQSIHQDSTHPAADVARAAAQSITLQRDPLSDEWVFDLSPGIDLLEVIRVLSVVQTRALELLQQQLQSDGSPSAAAHSVSCEHLLARVAG